MGTGDQSDQRSTHARVMEVLADALDLPAERRSQFLDQACSDDRALRAEVDRLLANEAAAAAAMSTAHAQSELARPLQPPEQIGACRIIRELGHGGMSVVYLATQQSPVRRPVAIKLLLPGMDSRQIVRRFEAERQALAVMNHPNVAQVYDAGTTEAGRPYFIMEYVDGVSITDFCDTNRLTTRQRLDLLIAVCEAVQHAHQKSIIHRDLKPSNVLVTQREGRAVPKVIDFGIAKAVDHAAAARTIFTEHGQLLGTPEYMSPEQASLGGVDVDTRTDVYSLGVLLYELLTGSLPFDPSQLRGAAYDEIRRLIREVDPPRPSTRLSTTIHDTATIAAARQSDARTLLRHVRGDLDWITMKAMEKDRGRRYGSPAEMAEDLRRHLRNEPVTACPPTSIYRVRKFVRRHRTAVAVAALILVMLAGGMFATTSLWLRARRAERLALEQKALAERRFNDVRKLAGTLIVDVDQTIQTAGPTKARQQLVQTALEYLDKLSEESDDVSLLREITQGYTHVGNVQYYPGASHLGDPAGAIASYNKAHLLSQRWVAADPQNTAALAQLAASYVMLGEAQEALSQHDQALQSFADARPIYERLQTIDPQAWRWPRNIGLLLDKSANVRWRKGEGELALSGFNEALKIYEQVAARFPGEIVPRRDVMTVHANLASLVVNMGLTTDAITHARQAADRAAALSASDPANLIWEHDAMLERQRLVECLITAGYVTEPLREMERIVAYRRKLSKEDPSSYQARRQVANALTILADAQTLAGALGSALETYTEALTIRQQLSAADPDDQAVRRGVADLHRSLAVALRKVGRYDEAIGHIDECLKIHEQRLARPGAPGGVRLSISFALRVKAEILLDQDKLADAIPLLEQAAEIYAKPAPPSERRELVFVLASLARAQLDAGRVDDALVTERQTRELADGVLERSPDDHTIGGYRTCARLVAAQALIDRNEPVAGELIDEVEQWAAKLHAAEPAAVDFMCISAAAAEAGGDLSARRGDTITARARYQRALESWRSVQQVAPDLAVCPPHIRNLEQKLDRV